MEQVKRRVFFSFHYKRDSWRVQQITNSGVVEGQKICSPNEWGKVKKNNDNGIKNWINEQMRYRSCVIILIGQETYRRKWINYEIKKAWEDKKGLFGIYIHNLKNKDSQKDRKGYNPFDYFSIRQQPLSHFAEIQKRGKTNLDIFWLKDESLEDVENLPRPEVLANEICSHLESALREMRRLGV